VKPVSQGPAAGQEGLSQDARCQSLRQAGPAGKWILSGAHLLLAAGEGVKVCAQQPSSSKGLDRMSTRASVFMPSQSEGGQWDVDRCNPPSTKQSAICFVQS